MRYLNEHTKLEQSVSNFDQKYSEDGDREEETNKYFILKNKTQLTQLAAKLEILERFKSLLWFVIYQLMMLKRLIGICFVFYLVCHELNKKDDILFTYNEFSYLNNDLEDLLGYESAYYVETMIKTTNKPFINPGKK